MHSCNLSSLTGNHLQPLFQSGAYHCLKAKRPTAMMYFQNAFSSQKKAHFTLLAMWQATWKFCQWSEIVKIWLCMHFGRLVLEIFQSNLKRRIKRHLPTVLVLPKWQSKKVWNKFNSGRFSSLLSQRCSQNSHNLHYQNVVTNMIFVTCFPVKAHQ